MGMFPGMVYEENNFQFESDDLLALFSDGVPEAQNAAEEEWGEINLRERLDKAKKVSAQNIINQIVGEIDRFADDAAQHDDITLFVLRPLNKSASRIL